MNLIRSDMDKGRMFFEKEKVRNFGFLLSGFLGILGAIALSRQIHFYAQLYLLLAAISLVMNLINPRSIFPIYLVMTKVALVIGKINTILILTVVFYLMLVPIGLLFKLFGKDILNQKIDKKENSYWRKKNQRDYPVQFYENQF